MSAARRSSRQWRIRVTATHGLRTLERAQTVVVPGWRGIDAPVPPPLLAALRRAHGRGARVASICSGVFVLAAAGLLDGRRATTHWRYADTLSARFPQVTVEPNALYVDEGSVLTSAGSAAGLDMLLHLVRRDHGWKAANPVAQRLVLPAHRMGDQAQYVPRPMPDEAGRLSHLLDWLRARPAQAHTVDSMAARAPMSRRTLQRQFTQATGWPPLEWLLRERVGVAKDLLESGRLAVAQVGEKTGFGSDESFRRIAGVSPSAYQKQFARR